MKMKESLKLSCYQLLRNVAVWGAAGIFVMRRFIGWIPEICHFYAATKRKPRFWLSFVEEVKILWIEPAGVPDPGVLKIKDLHTIQVILYRRRRCIKRDFVYLRAKSWQLMGIEATAQMSSFDS